MTIVRTLVIGSLLVLATVAARAAEPPASPRLSCRGEEPFWGLEADGSAGRFTEPGAEQSLPGRLESLDWLPPGWLVWRSTDPQQPLTVTLRREPCASTMADGPPMSHRAILVAGDAPAVAGCCTVEPASAQKSLDAD